jgi:hypothetical protein
MARTVNIVGFMETKKVSWQDQVDRAKEAIAYTYDGPVTVFVLIARAMREVAGGVDDNIMANALMECLSEHGVTENRTLLYSTEY